MRRVVFLLIISLVLTSSLSPDSLSSPSGISLAPPTDYPWMMFHYNALRAGATGASAPSSGNLMWKYVTGAPVYASPAVTDGLVIITSWDGGVYALNEFSGQLKWTYFTGGHIFSSPAVANGIVYVGSWDGILYALNEQTGAVVWRTGNPNDPITSSPLVADGKVFYGNFCQSSIGCNPPGYFEALNANTGAFLWTNATVANDHIISSPSTDNGRVFFGENDGTIIALNETNGKSLWSVNPAGSGNPQTISSAPAIAYGRVYVGTGDRFVALDEQTGTIDWTFNTGGNNATSGAVSGGMVYFGTGNGRVHAVNATTGVQKWSRATGGAINSSPALALGSNTLMIGSNDHYLYALSMATGAVLWRFLTGASIWSSPAVANGSVFFGSQDSTVYGLGVKLPQLAVTVNSTLSGMRPGQVSQITIAVTNGTSPTSANLTLSSSLGGSFSSPVQQSLGVYDCNYTSPSLTSPGATTIQAVASRSGFIDGTGQATISLNPFPTLTVQVSANPSFVTSGGQVLLMVRVVNGTMPIAAANISATSSQGGVFSTVTDKGNGNYTVNFSAGLADSNPTITVKASKPNFSTGQGQVSITVAASSWFDGAKYYGLPLYLFLIALLVIAFLLLIGALSRKKKAFQSQYPDAPAYVFKSESREGLTRRFRTRPQMGLAAIAGS